jgi:hypothetical protein
MVPSFECSRAFAPMKKAPHQQKLSEVMCRWGCSKRRLFGSLPYLMDLDARYRSRAAVLQFVRRESGNSSFLIGSDLVRECTGVKMKADNVHLLIDSVRAVVSDRFYDKAVFLGSRLARVLGSGPDDRKTGEIFRDVEPEDLLQYGLIPEFVGRLPVLATLEDLDEPALKRILVEPKNALVKQYQRLFEMENVNLSLAEEALLDRRLRHSLLERLHIGGDVERLDIDQRHNAGGIEPGEEIRDGPVIGHAGVLVADGGGKELQEAAHGGVAGAGDRRRHGQAAAPVARGRGCPGTPNRDDLIHGWV